MGTDFRGVKVSDAEKRKVSDSEIWRNSQHICKFNTEKVSAMASFISYRQTASTLRRTRI
jgi:hypothetical protein